MRKKHYSTSGSCLIVIFDFVNKTVPLIFFILLYQASIGQTTKPVKDTLENYFKEHKDSLDQLEGYWDVSAIQEHYNHDTLSDVERSQGPIRILIIRADKKFNSFDLNGKSFDVEFSSTDVKGVYLYQNYFPQINQHSSPQVVIYKASQIEYTYDYPKEWLQDKLGNKFKEGMRVVNVLKWTKIL